jgi:hypothetical protein
MAIPPRGKRVLNTQISVEEHGFLREMAERQSMTITMYLRSLIRSEMTRVNGEQTASQVG